MIRRRRFTAISLVSLLMLAATAVLWVRSYRTADTLSFHVNGHRANVIVAYGFLASSARGEAHFGVTCYPAMRVPGSFEWTGQVLRVARRDVDDPAAALLPVPSFLNPPGRSWRRAGFGGWHGLYAGEDRRAIVIPDAALAALFALAPVRWTLHRLLRARAHRQKRCCTCGYDLRASTDRCPECGTPIAVKMTV
ncbi:MAG TPA: hypothetical protein VGI81_23710 [Tepidisphaeraceae bacterium]|jgi:hypothetical protein